MPTQGCQKSVTHYCERGWVTRNSLIPLHLASVSSDKGWQSLLPGTLVLLVGSIGLMVTQTTEVNKNKDWIVDVGFSFCLF